MNNFISVLIIEDDVQACEELTQCIAQYEDMKVAAVCNSSTDALEKARYHLPNVIILDLELHHGEGNGLMFLDSLLANPLSVDPFILVTTNNMSTITLDQAKALGADFTLTKYSQGYSAQYVVDNIRMLRNAIRRKNTTNRVPTLSPAMDEQLLKICIQRHLDIIGIKAKAKGYNYLTESIYMVITKDDEHLSRALAAKYKKTTASIERAMQNAIKQAWTTNDVQVLFDNYTAPIHPDKGYPTMMEFIYYYANIIKREIEVENMNVERAKLAGMR